MVLESQVQEASNLNERLTQDLDDKDGELLRLQEELSESSSLRQTERLIQDKVCHLTLDTFTHNTTLDWRVRELQEWTKEDTRFWIKVKETNREIVTRKRLLWMSCEWCYWYICRYFEDNSERTRRRACCAEEGLAGRGLVEEEPTTVKKAEQRLATEQSNSGDTRVKCQVSKCLLRGFVSNLSYVQLWIEIIRVVKLLVICWKKLHAFYYENYQSTL